MNLPPDLQPAVPDPKRLRRTAWILVAIMLTGGILVLGAYENWATARADDARPSVVHRIRKERDLRVVRQDGTTADLFDLRGNVWAVHVLSLRDADAAARGLGVMKRLAAAYAGNDAFRLVTLVADPPADASETASQLRRFAEFHGMHLPQWWVATNEAATLHKFIKTELKASRFPHEEAGRWVLDSSVVLIDRGGHLRRAVVPQKRGGAPYVAVFDFDQAAEWDARGVKTGTELSNEAQLESLLRDTIDALLIETVDFQ
jgi:cytochrome oxidase Cu insertion factor (SCO1/SenC/PrrC family)